MTEEAEPREGLDDHSAPLARLRAALLAGEQSGTSGPFDFDAFLASKKSADDKS